MYASGSRDEPLVQLRMEHLSSVCAKDIILWRKVICLEAYGCALGDSLIYSLILMAQKQFTEGLARIDATTST